MMRCDYAIVKSRAIGNSGLPSRQNQCRCFWKTSTPWTIPSNLAIAFHPDHDYAAYDVRGTTVILAERLADQVAQATGLALGAPVARIAPIRGVRSAICPTLPPGPLAGRCSLSTGHCFPNLC